MPISEAARRTHERLFPGQVPVLATTDPELAEVFDNFTFDEVLRHGDLDARTRLMTQLAALIAAVAVSEYRVMLGAALTVGVTAVEAKEIVYQAVPRTRSYRSAGATAWGSSRTAHSPAAGCPVATVRMTAPRVRRRRPVPPTGSTCP
jgi:alkylhydroperoxidase/carboxymuconolactone decarboxylase family protein YurZ